MFSQEKISPGIAEISKKAIQVRPRGVGEAYAVTLSTVIITNPIERVKAVIAYPERHKLTDRVTEALKAFFAGHVHFNDFFRGLPDDLRRRLQEHIDSELSDDGHILEHLTVETLVHGPKIEPFLSLENIAVERTTPEGRGLRIRNDLQLTLVDAARFKAAQIAEIRVWIKKELNETIEKRLFGKRYVDFLLRFGPIKDAIVEDLSQRVQAIGYKLDQLISQPDMPEELWFKPQSRTFTYDDGLPTRDAKITVNIEIVVGFELPRQGSEAGDPSPIEPLLNKNVDIQFAIKESLRAEIEMIMHEQAPDDVYMRFSLPREVDSNGDRRSLEERLQDCTEAHLETRYSAILHRRAVIKPLDSDIGIFVNDLINRRDDIELEISPHSGPETYRFRGRIRVDSPVENGWHLIVKRNFAFEDIKKQCIVALECRLRSIENPRLLAYTSPKQQQDLEQVAAKIVQRSIAEHYGFYVFLSDFQRDKTATEDALSAAEISHTLSDVDEVVAHLALDNSRREHSSELTRAQLAAKRKRLETLDKKELELMGKADDDESRDRIEQIRQERSQILDEGVEGGPSSIEERLAKARRRVHPQQSLPTHEDYGLLTGTIDQAHARKVMGPSGEIEQGNGDGGA